MSKSAYRDVKTGRFVIGRGSAEKFSAIEGQRRSPRTGRIIEQSDASGETTEQRRDRIRKEFAERR